jgi:hypothetical protein
MPLYRTQKLQIPERKIIRKEKVWEKESLGS